MKPTTSDRYDMIVEVRKFNPYHDGRGRFTTPGGAGSMTFRTESKAGQKAIENIRNREKARAAAVATSTPVSRFAKRLTDAGMSQDRADAIVKMVGSDEIVNEYDTGDHPNKYPPDDPRWGTEPGQYTVYRSGDTNRDIVFTASTYEGSAPYADGFPVKTGGDISPTDPAVYAYTVDIKKPFVAKDIHDTYQQLFGKKLNLDPTPAQIKKGITSSDLWIKADEKIAAKLTRMGYDAWTMTNPAPPAKKELNILKNGKSNMTETARSIPEHVLGEWEDAAMKGGYFAHAYENGKQVMTINEWFQTDDYKAGKAAGKWA